MKLSGCAKNGITKIRKPQWQPNAYLELYLTDRGLIGPWAKLYDQPTQTEVLHVESPQTILILGDKSEDWEEFSSNRIMQPIV